MTQAEHEAMIVSNFNFNVKRCLIDEFREATDEFPTESRDAMRAQARRILMEAADLL